MSVLKDVLNSQKLVMDNAALGFGYMPRPGIDVPLEAGGVSAVMATIDAEELYLTNSIARNIIDLPAEDLTRNGWTIRMEDEQLANDLNERLRDLNVQDVLTEMFKYQRLYGSGAVFIGLDENGDVAPADEVDETNLNEVTYLTPFSRKLMASVIYNDDVTSPDYNKVMRLSLKSQDIDKSRFLFANGLMLEQEQWGRSLFEGMIPELSTASVAIDSIQKMLNDFVFKVYKSPDAANMSVDDKLAIGSVANHQFKTDALAILTNEEDLGNESKVVSGIHELLDYSWERVAAAARMPKSVIMGQESGTLTGAQYDLMNYYSRIKTLQENELRPHLERLIRLLLWAKYEPGGQINPDEIDWSVEFKPLYQLDTTTETQIAYSRAQTDAIYIDKGVESPEEVRESRFGALGTSGGSKGNIGDSADFSPNEVGWLKKLWKKADGD